VGCQKVDAQELLIFDYDNDYVKKNLHIKFASKSFYFTKSEIDSLLRRNL